MAKYILRAAFLSVVLFGLVNCGDKDSGGGGDGSVADAHLVNNCTTGQIFHTTQGCLQSCGQPGYGMLNNQCTWVGQQAGMCPAGQVQTQYGCLNACAGQPNMGNYNGTCYPQVSNFGGMNGFGGGLNGGMGTNWGSGWGTGWNWNYNFNPYYYMGGYQGGIYFKAGYYHPQSRSTNYYRKTIRRTTTIRRTYHTTGGGGDWIGD